VGPIFFLGWRVEKRGRLKGGKAQRTPQDDLALGNKRLWMIASRANIACRVRVD
jgi:hypothetical protein